MYSISVKNSSGDMYELTNDSDYSIYKITGLNPPVANINRTNNTTTDGSTTNSVKLNERNIVIYVKFKNDIEASRLKLYKIFPQKQIITVFFKNRARNVYILGEVESVDIDLFSQSEEAQISIICPDPYFRDKKELSVQLGTTVPLFSFPFEIPSYGIPISEYQTNNHSLIINPGDNETGISIELHAAGSVLNPTIHNVHSGQTMRLICSLEAKDILYINTMVNQKAIKLYRDGMLSDVLGYVRPDSDWLTLSPGDNVYAYSCESGAGNLILKFIAPILYSGV